MACVESSNGYQRNSVRRTNQSLRHLSPFRFPGGKTWLLPYVRSWLRAQPRTPLLLIEPFAGGAIVGLTSVYEHMVEKLLISEIDDEIASVWDVIVNRGDGGYILAETILNFEFTDRSVEEVLSRQPLTIVDKAFQTIVRNRIARGGILAPGAGRIKRGENDKGLKSRWYPQTLHNRILTIIAMRDRIEFVHGDGIAIINRASTAAESAFFIDPPYSVGQKRAASRLYTHFEIDHENLFRTTQMIAGDFLMTYDSDPYIRELALKYGFHTIELTMKNTHHLSRKELLIGRNLDWVQELYS